MARNTNRQGAGFELDVMEYLRVRGWDAMRSSGSRGAVDVMAIAPASLLGALWGRSLLFIQCKITNPLLPPPERRGVLNWSMRAGAVPLVAYKEPDGRRKPVRFRLLTGTGPKEFEPWHPACKAHGDLCGPYEEHEKRSG